MADVFSLDKLSIKKLKALAGRNNVSLRGCFEKSDIIKTLRDAGVKEHSGPPPASQMPAQRLMVRPLRRLFWRSLQLVGLASMSKPCQPARSKPNELL